MNFSGTYHPIVYLVKRCKVLLPGIEAVVGIYKSADNEIKIIENDSETSLSNELKAGIQTWRNKSNNSWLQSTDSIFNFRSDKSQVSIEDEQHLRTLVLNLQSPYDKLSDLLIITFPAHYTIQSLGQSFNNLSTGEKHLLTNLLSSIFNAEYKRVLEEKELLNIIETVSDAHKKENVILSSKLEQTEQLYTKAVKSIIQQVVEEQQRLLKKEITFNKNVVNKIARESIDFKEIKKVIKLAISVHYNLNINKSSIEIDEHSLVFNNSKVDDFNFNSQSSTDKIFNLLERYEESASKAKMKGLSVNGKNVARFLTPSITPPAITDALKKNSKRIHFLLEKYPSKWKLIRAGLRPLSNIDDYLKKAS